MQSIQSQKSQRGSKRSSASPFDPATARSVETENEGDITVAFPDMGFYTKTPPVVAPENEWDIDLAFPKKGSYTKNASSDVNSTKRSNSLPSSIEYLDHIQNDERFTNMGSPVDMDDEHQAFFSKIHRAFECVSWSADERTAIANILRKGLHLKSPEEFLVHFREEFRTMSADKDRSSHNLVFLLLSVLFCGSNERVLPAAAAAATATAAAVAATTVGPNERRYKHIVDILNTTPLPAADRSLSSHLSECSKLKAAIKAKLESEGLYEPADTTVSPDDVRMPSLGAKSRMSSFSSLDGVSRMFSLGSTGQQTLSSSDARMQSIGAKSRVSSLGSGSLQNTTVGQDPTLVPKHPFNWKE
jgi:hypothetical protein